MRSHVITFLCRLHMKMAPQIISCSFTRLNFVQHVLICSVRVLLTKLYHHLITIGVTRSHIMPRPPVSDHTPHLAEVYFLMNCGHDRVIGL